MKVRLKTEFWDERAYKVWVKRYLKLMDYFLYFGIINLGINLFVGNWVFSGINGFVVLVYFLAVKSYRVSRREVI